MGEEVDPRKNAVASGSITSDSPPLQLPLSITAPPAPPIAKQDFGMFGFAISVVVAFLGQTAIRLLEDILLGGMVHDMAVGVRFKLSAVNA